MKHIAWGTPITPENWTRMNADGVRVICAWMIRPRALALIGEVAELLDWKRLATEGVFTDDRVKLELVYDRNGDIWNRCTVPITERYGGSSVTVKWSPQVMDRRVGLSRWVRLEMANLWRMLRR